MLTLVTTVLVITWRKQLRMAIAIVQEARGLTTSLPYYYLTTTLLLPRYLTTTSRPYYLTTLLPHYLTAVPLPYCLTSTT